MADIRTLDPDIVIEAMGARRGVPFVRYRRVSTSERWTVNGTCNQCGLCVIGAAEPRNYDWQGPAGTPMAVIDKRVTEGRLDEPVTPAFFDAMKRQAKQTPTATVSGCSLRLGRQRK